MSKNTNKTLKKLNSFIKDINDGNIKEVLRNLQLMCDYQAEKLRIYEEHLTQKTYKVNPIREKAFGSAL